MKKRHHVTLTHWRSRQSCVNSLHHPLANLFLSRLPSTCQSFSERSPSLGVGADGAFSSPHRMTNWLVWCETHGGLRCVLTVVPPIGRTLGLPTLGVQLTRSFTYLASFPTTAICDEDKRACVLRSRHPSPPCLPHLPMQASNNASSNNGSAPQQTSGAASGGSFDCLRG